MKLSESLEDAVQLMGYTPAIVLSVDDEKYKLDKKYSRRAAKTLKKLSTDDLKNGYMIVEGTSFAESNDPLKSEFGVVVLVAESSFKAVMDLRDKERELFHAGMRLLDQEGKLNIIPPSFLDDTSIELESSTTFEDTWNKFDGIVMTIDEFINKQSDEEVPKVEYEEAPTEVEEQDDYIETPDSEVKEQDDYIEVSDPEIKEQDDYIETSDPEIKEQDDYTETPDPEVKEQNDHVGKSLTKIKQTRVNNRTRNRDVELEADDYVALKAALNDQVDKLVPTYKVNEPIPIPLTENARKNVIIKNTAEIQNVRLETVVKEANEKLQQKRKLVVSEVTNDVVANLANKILEIKSETNLKTSNRYGESLSEIKIAYEQNKGQISDLVEGQRLVYEKQLKDDRERIGQRAYNEAVSKFDSENSETVEQRAQEFKTTIEDTLNKNYQDAVSKLSDEANTFKFNKLEVLPDQILSEKHDEIKAIIADYKKDTEKIIEDTNDDVNKIKEYFDKRLDDIVEKMSTIEITPKENKSESTRDDSDNSLMDLLKSQIVQNGQQNQQMQQLITATLINKSEKADNTQTTAVEPTVKTMPRESEVEESKETVVKHKSNWANKKIVTPVLAGITMATIALGGYGYIRAESGHANSPKTEKVAKAKHTNDDKNNNSEDSKDSSSDSSTSKNNKLSNLKIGDSVNINVDGKQQEAKILAFNDDKTSATVKDASGAEFTIQG